CHMSHSPVPFDLVGSAAAFRLSALVHFVRLSFPTRRSSDLSEFFINPVQICSNTIRFLHIIISRTFDFRSHRCTAIELIDVKKRSEEHTSELVTFRSRMPSSARKKKK